MRLLWAIALSAPFARPSDFTTNETAWCRDHIYLPSGGFCPNAPYAGMDSSLAASLVEYFERHHRDERVETTIGDFGAGAAGTAKTSTQGLDSVRRRTTTRRKPARPWSSST